MKHAPAVLAALLFALLPSPTHAVQQVETEHFVVVFNPGQAFWANQVIEIAEEVWDNLAVAYDLLEDYQKIYVYVKDEGDFPEAYAIPTKNRVTISTTHLELGIRSTDGWIRNALTHELAHIFSVKAANKDHFLRNFTVSSFSSHQNPDWSVSLNYDNLLAPTWWIEGIAQYEAYKNGCDSWDTHRDMFLRMATLEDDLLDYLEMSTFDNRNGFYPEMTYNQGYSLMLYLESRWGEEVVRKIAKSRSIVHFNESLLRATGTTGQKLYRAWTRQLRQKYQDAAEAVGDVREGEMLFDGGFWDFYGTRSPDGRYVAMISNTGYDVLYPKLVLYDTKTGKVKRLLRHGLQPVYQITSPSAACLPSPAGAHRLAGSATPRAFESRSEPDPRSIRAPTVYSRLQWSADGKLLCYARWTKGSPYRDVYLYDMEERTERQITWHARAKDPALSPDGKTIAYVHNDAGTQNLALVDADGKNTRYLTNFNNGTQLYQPCWAPDGARLYIGIMHGTNRDIAVVNTTAEPFDRRRKQTDSTFFADSLNYQQDLNLLLVVHTDADERDPCLTPDGAYLYFSSDRSGIFNIYRMNLKTWEVQQATNVLGGAFAPSVDASGHRLTYTGFHAANYSIYELDMQKTDAVEQTYVGKDYSRRDTDPYLFDAKPSSGQYREEKYAPRFTIWHFGPFLSFQPAYITDSVGLSHMRTGFDIYAGELGGFVSTGGNLYLAKDFRNNAGPSWGGSAFAGLGVPEVFGENRNFRPQMYSFATRAVVRDEESFDAVYTETDLAGYIPSSSSRFVAPDTLVAAYVDATEGSFYYERVFNDYGIVGSLEIDRRNLAGLYIARSRDYLNGSIFGQRLRSQSRAYRINGHRYESVRDITSQVRGDGTEGLIDSLLEELADTGTADDLLDLYDHFDLYRDTRLGVQYQFANIEPSFALPFRAGIVALAAEFINASYNVGSHLGEYQAASGGSDKTLLYTYGAAGRQVPLYSSVERTQDFFRMELTGLQRFPLPLNTILSRSPRPFGLRHFATGTAFFGSLNRELSDNGVVYPLQYRIARYLKAYPYAFDPVEPARLTEHFTVQRVEGRDPDSLAIDSVSFVDIGDQSRGDILWGNNISFYTLEYTLELLRGATFRPFGMLFKGLYISPFYEAAAVWNVNWRDFEFKRLAPLRIEDGKPVWRSPFLRDCGLRFDLPFLIFDTWNGLASFTWARRLDLDDAIVDIDYDVDPNGRLIGLAKDRFSFAVHLW